KGFAHRSLPRDLVWMFWWALTSEKVYAHRSSGCRRTWIDGGERNAHCGIPNMFALIDLCKRLEARIPLPAVFMMWIMQVNVQVNPLALGGHFELFVTLNIGEVRADEHFCYIPIPQLIGFLASIWVGLQVELFIGAGEQKIKIAF